MKARSADVADAASPMRMTTSQLNGNPGMDNLAAIFDVLRDSLRVEIEVHTVGAVP